MTMKTIANKTKSSAPEVPNFNFERHAAAHERAKIREEAQDPSIDDQARTQVAASPEFPERQVASELTPEDATYVSVRLHQVVGIAAMIGRAYAPDYTSQERPAESDTYYALDFARRLLHECLAFLDAPGRLALSSQSDMWHFDVYKAAALLDVFDSIVWSDALEIHVADSELHGFLSAAQSAAGRAFAGLEAGQRVRNVREMREQAEERSTSSSTVQQGHARSERRAA